jgi:hypothetical protein
MNLYKYLSDERFEAFKEKGAIHLNTMNNLKTLEKSGIGDKQEGSILIKAEDTITLSGVEFKKLIMPELNAKSTDKGSIVVSKGATFDVVSKAFVFCTTKKRNDEYWANLGCGSHYTIVNPLKFAETLDAKLYAAAETRGFKMGTIKYLGKKGISLNVNNTKFLLKKPRRDFWSPCFEKDECFRIQNEYRIVFAYVGHKKMEPITLTCPELKKYCQL